MPASTLPGNTSIPLQELSRLVFRRSPNWKPPIAQKEAGQGHCNGRWAVGNTAIVQRTEDLGVIESKTWAFLRHQELLSLLMVAVGVFVVVC